MATKQPKCPVPDEFNATHSGGAGKGPLFFPAGAGGKTFSIPFACMACLRKLRLAPREQVPDSYFDALATKP